MVWHNVRQLVQHKVYRLLIPLLIFNGFEQGFVYADYNKVSVYMLSWCWPHPLWTLSLSPSVIHHLYHRDSLRWLQHDHLGHEQLSLLCAHWHGRTTRPPGGCCWSGGHPASWAHGISLGLDSRCLARTSLLHRVCSVGHLWCHLANPVQQWVSHTPFGGSMSLLSSKQCPLLETDDTQLMSLPKSSKRGGSEGTTDIL